MDKHALWKWLLLLVLVSFSMWVVTPPKDKIQLGLDLKGGTSFIVKIDEQAVRDEIKARNPGIEDSELNKQVAKILNGAQSRAVEVIRNRIDTLGIAEPAIYPGKDNRIIIQLPGVDAKKRKEAEKSIRSLAFLEFRMVHKDNDKLVEKLFSRNLAPEGYKIKEIGGRKYYVRDKKSLPDEKMDVEYYAKRGRFHAPSKEYELLLQKSEESGETVYTPVFVKRRYELSGDNLSDAWVDLEMTGEPVIKLEFDSKGAKKFGVVTSDYAPGGARNPNPNTYRRLAIVLDGTLYSAPRINVAIYDGSAKITGSFTRAEADQLANVLRAGSLPAPVKIVETRFVAPSLGQDSINSGIRAILLGGVTVILFMLFYYMFSGLIADIALLLNMILLPLGMIIAAGFLSMGHTGGGGSVIKLPVLTLPGIAGILLTIGMAVDANVLIFERIREEVGTGKRLWTSITAGYDRAFLTIMDANVTTLLTGIILFIFGSGPIRGFAVTLCAGIIVSMYTALVVTKMLFSLVAKKNNEKVLKMLCVIKNTKIDFVSMRKIAISISLILIVSSWVIMVMRGLESPNKIFGVDFTGGAAITYTYDKRVDGDTIKSTLSKAGITDPNVQYQTEVGADNKKFVVIKASGVKEKNVKVSAAIKECIKNNFAGDGFKVLQEDEVGPQIGKELRGKAVRAIIVALLGIIIYVSWRFELGFAVGAIVALVHDVLITVGLYTLFGRQLSLPIIAALLTIVGYSVNDTIVVFDRIREDLKLKRSMSFKDICNLSINQTLSRTLLTSFTTLITVVMLLLFGGGAIFDFALALFIGIIVGTYSSIFIATPVVLLWYRDKKPALGGKIKV